MRKLLWLVIGMMAVIASSCEDFLDVSSYFDDTLKYDSVFTTRQNLERYLWGAAGQLPDESAIFGNDVLPGETGTDEIFTLMTEDLFHGKALTLGLVSPSNLRGMNAWDPCYKVIRKANTILNRIDECQDITPLQRAEILGYTHFMRGYAYYMILMSYGPAVLLGDDVMDTNRYDKDAHHPSLNAEVYGTNWSGRPSWCIARNDYANEKAFASYYVQNYLDDLAGRACGWIHWMLAETYGEGYTIYLNGRRNQKSLGSCAMDGNRFAKLPYRIYQKALWVPFDQRPGVTLQSHWNLSGVQDVDAWSNCPQVELMVDGVSHGTVTPDPATRRCTWPGIQWKPGTVRAIGRNEQGHEVCSDEIVTAGEPQRLEVTIEPQGIKPDGTPFVLRANASDAFIATVRVVDRDGHWCPLANPLLHFSVEGEGVYKGSYNFYVAEGQPLSYHAPGDPELQAEGGLMRVAVRTTFTPGAITVRVTSPGLLPGQATTHSQTF